MRLILQHLWMWLTKTALYTQLYSLHFAASQKCADILINRQRYSGATVGNNETDSDVENQEERRGAPRRWVMLRLSIEDAGNIVISKTLNISESGLLIENSAELNVQQDQILQVVVEGQIADDAEAQTRDMLVVRVNPESVALTYID